MKRIDVSDLTERNIDGRRANVRGQLETGAHGPLYRTLIEARWLTDREGLPWLFLLWHKEGPVEIDGNTMIADPGFAGRSAIASKGWEIEIEALEDWQEHEKVCSQAS